MRNLLRLPSLICLIALHRRLRGVVPRSRRLALHVVLADERCLNLPGATRVNRLLAALLRTGFRALLAVGAPALLSYGVTGSGGGGRAVTSRGFRGWCGRSRQHFVCPGRVVRVRGRLAARARLT